jgi:LacI family transcriptional regulator
MRRARMKDIAALAGVSPTTGSFVLAGRDDMRVSEATRQRVLQTARELNYRPNQTARSLRTQVSRTFGFVSDRVVTDDYAGDLIRGSLLRAAEGDHHLLIGETNGESSTRSQVLEDLLDRQVDSFVLATSWTRRVRVPTALKGQRLVLLNCTAGSGFSAVVPDEEGAARSAVEVLLRHGHGDGIVLVGETPRTVVAAWERRRGIEASLAAAGRTLAAHVDTTWWPEPSFEAVRAFLVVRPKVTAFLCLNDRVAFGTYQALAEAGLRVPDDVSVVSFDDSTLAGWVRPGLTSVALPYREMGALAVEALLLGGTTPRRIRVPMSVRERDSVAPPNG